MKASRFVEDREIEPNEIGYDLRLKEGTLKELDENFISKEEVIKIINKINTPCEKGGKIRTLTNDKDVSAIWWNRGIDSFITKLKQKLNTTKGSVKEG